LIKKNYQKQHRKLILIAAIAVNLFILGAYKYANFFFQNINFIFSSNFFIQNVVLPLGISFFTFTQIAFLVDSYKGLVKECNFLNYILFVTFFPHLIAGPIIHHKEMMPQFDSLRKKLFNHRNVSKGIFLFSIGLFKKTVIADSFATWANAGFARPEILNAVAAWVTSLSYTLQLYFDFSGYTDMALGISLLFNIKLPNNFNSPYKAIDIHDFWKRWHITLSRFLKDYIYIPLGGNRNGAFNTYKNILVTFLLGGLWHGAGWTFIFWGFINGVALVINRIWQKFNIKMNKAIAWFITFNFINICWVFFRAKNMDGAARILKGMVGLGDKVELGKSLDVIEGGQKLIIMLTIFLIIVIFAKNSDELTENFKPNFKTVSFATLLFLLSIFNMNKISEFIYFNF
jgi:D-alanyl-lipoteichoic acid acyltransferase DltB (MBOAT superfamily)